MKTGDTTDSLLAGAIQGDEAAFEALYGRFATRLAHYVSDRISGRNALRMEPEDLVQEVFSEVFTRINRFEPRGKGSFYKLLLTIANRRLVNARRRFAARQEEGPGVALAEVASTHTGPLTALLRAEDRELCRRAFALLPEKDRKVLWLRIVEERGAREIGELTGKSVGAVWVWFHRALKAWSAQFDALRGE
jgi:RNA polymerase sigma-70 factor, ECF subfamily